MTPEPDFISLSRRFAALSGPFHPRAAIEASQVDPASPEALDLTADLASACEIQKDPESGVRWLMRTSARSWELQALGPDGRAAAAAWRRKQPAFDGPAQDIVMALAGEGGFAPDVIEARLLAIENGEPAQVLELERLTCALEWAGPAGPSFRLLDRVRAAVDRQHEAQRGESLLQSGFLGREAERKRLVDWIAQPIPQGRVTALFVTGLPAIGKSTLLEQAIRDAAAIQGPALVIRLDFDRAGLDVRDQVGLTMEVSRQLAAQLPQQAHAMRTARLVAAAVDDEETKGDRRDRIPPALASAMAQDLQASGRPILFLLDTLEALLSRGASHIQQLFGWLDALLSYGLAPMSVIAAGRGEALAPARDRISGPPVELDALTPEDGLALLGRLGVPQELHDRIQTQAQGNPLKLRIGAAFATGADANGEPPADLTDEAHLYRALKSRIVQPELAALVEPGLLLRRINAEALGEVMTVAAGQPRADAQAAQALFEALIAHQWLMQPDPDAPGWWRQVPAMRTVLLPRLAKGRRARRLHALARDWFAKRPEPWAPVESLYHRLQALRGKVPLLNPELAAQFDPQMIAELPPAARDAVAWARGESSSYGREAPTAASPGAGVDPRAVTDLQFAIERADWIEGSYLYNRALENVYVDPVSPLADAARTVLWRVGRWVEARASLREHDLKLPGDSDLQALPPEMAIARAEMRAEFDPKGLRRRLRADPGYGQTLERLVERGGKGQAAGSALSFVLHAVRPRPPMTGTRVDPVVAAFTLWGREGSADQLTQAVAAGRRRLDDVAARLDAAPEASDARALAVLSPHGELPRLLVQSERAGGLWAYAEQLTLALEEAAWPECPRAPFSLEAVSNAGLAAEWLTMAALALRDSNLALVARSAEAWRQTVAGRWRYGAAPRGWRGSPRLDEVTLARTRRLADSGRQTARAEIDAWLAGMRPAARLPQRAEAVAERRHQAWIESPEPARAAAIDLVGARIPTPIVPGFAVLFTS